jgi:hypothetical protein
VFIVKTEDKIFDFIFQYCKNSTHLLSDKVQRVHRYTCWDTLVKQYINCKKNNCAKSHEIWNYGHLLSMCGRSGPLNLFTNLYFHINGVKIKTNVDFYLGRAYCLSSSMMDRDKYFRLALSDLYSCAIIGMNELSFLQLASATFSKPNKFKYLDMNLIKSLVSEDARSAVCSSWIRTSNRR